MGFSQLVMLLLSLLAVSTVRGVSSVAPCPSSWTRPPNNTYKIITILQTNTSDPFLNQAFVSVEQALKVMAYVVHDDQVSKGLPLVEPLVYYSGPSNRQILTTTFEALEDPSTQTCQMSIFGSLLSPATITIGTLSSLFDIPHTDVLSTSEQLDDKSRFPFFIRAGPSFIATVDSWAAFLATLQVTKVSLVLLSDVAAATVAGSFVPSFLSRNIAVQSVSLIPASGAVRSDYENAWSDIVKVQTRYVHAYFGEIDGIRLTYYGYKLGLIGFKSDNPYVLVGFERPLSVVQQAQAILEASGGDTSAFRAPGSVLSDWGLPSDATLEEVMVALNGVMAQSDDFVNYSSTWLPKLTSAYLDLYNTTAPIPANMAGTFDAYLALLYVVNKEWSNGFGCYLAGNQRNASFFIENLAGASFDGVSDRVFYDNNAAIRTPTVFTSEMFNGTTFTSHQLLRYYYNNTFSSLPNAIFRNQIFFNNTQDIQDYIRFTFAFNTFTPGTIPPDGILPPPAPPPPNPGSQDLTTEMGIGLGVGIGGVVFLLSLVAGLMYWFSIDESLQVIGREAIVLQNVLVFTKKGPIFEGTYAGAKALIYGVNVPKTVPAKKVKFNSNAPESGVQVEQSMLGQLRKAVSFRSTQTRSKRTSITALERGSNDLDVEKAAAALGVKCAPRIRPVQQSSGRVMSTESLLKGSSEAAVPIPEMPEGPRSLRPSLYIPPPPIGSSEIEDHQSTATATTFVELTEVRTEVPLHDSPHSNGDKPAPVNKRADVMSGNGHRQSPAPSLAGRTRSGAIPRPFPQNPVSVGSCSNTTAPGKLVPSESPVKRHGLLYQIPFSVLTKIRHPQILRCDGVIVSETDKHDVQCCIYEGAPSSLRQLLEDVQALSLETRMRIVLDVAKALEAIQMFSNNKLHKFLLIGKVLRFERVWITGAMRAKLAIDLAEDISEASDIIQKAPEILNQTPATPASDIYTLGIIALLTLTRKTPVSMYGSNTKTLREMAKSGGLHHKIDPETQGSLPPQILEMLTSMVHYMPSKRPTLSRIIGTFEEHLPSLEESFHGQKNSDSYLESLFPPAIAACLRRGEPPPPQNHDSVSIFFADIVGWTKLCADRSPQETHAMLERLFNGFDQLAQTWNVYKIESIGDAYFAVTNLVHSDSLHTSNLCHFALEAMEFAENTPIDESNPSGPTFRLRMGIHVGPVVSCVVGRVQPRYTLLGDSVNVASRCESTGVPGEIQISEAAAHALLEQSHGKWSRRLKSRGAPVEMKNKGPMKTFFLDRKAKLPEADGEPPRPILSPSVRRLTGSTPISPMAISPAPPVAVVPSVDETELIGGAGI